MRSVVLYCIFLSIGVLGSTNPTFRVEYPIKIEVGEGRSRLTFTGKFVGPSTLLDSIKTVESAEKYSDMVNGSALNGPYQVRFGTINYFDVKVFNNDVIFKVSLFFRALVRKAIDYLSENEITKDDYLIVKQHLNGLNIDVTYEFFREPALALTGLQMKKDHRSPKKEEVVDVPKPVIVDKPKLRIDVTPSPPKPLRQARAVERGPLNTGPQPKQNPGFFDCLITFLVKDSTFYFFLGMLTLSLFFLLIISIIAATMKEPRENPNKGVKRIHPRPNNTNFTDVRV